MESRQPFLDKDLVEYALKIEDSAKVHNGYTKYILREVMQDIMPEAIRTRVDKMGFSVPQDEWFAVADEPFVCKSI
jgi:asparagine synthase (glutamine-hydrolysing)